MKDIAKHYPLLTADERFRLFIEAMGRKDDQELDRLEATCPRRDYNAQDYEYRNAKSRFSILAMTSALERLCLDLLASTALTVALASTDAATGSAPEKAMDAFRKLVRVRQGKRDGWLQFCAQIGVNPDALTTPFLENVDWATNVAEAISETLAKSDATDVADTEKIAKQELEVLLDAWADNP